MTWPTAIIIDTTFIPLYTITLTLNALHVLRHGLKRTSGFISLLLVSILHLVGNILLVVEYTQHYTSINVTVWGYILQSIGLSFLVSASLAFYSRARAQMQEGDSGKGRVVRVGNVVNVVALVCVVTGYTSTSFTDAQGHVLGNVHLPAQAVVGAALYVGLSTAVLALSLVHLRSAATEARTIRIALLVASPLMLARAAWAVYTVEAGSVLVAKNIWAKLVLQYVCEFAALAVLTVLGFLVAKGEAGWDVERVDSSEAKMSHSWNAPQSLVYQQQQQQPISYPPPTQ
ncbi:uncharacterized protein SRS1_12943 [Sporisorium reilianum f. sp. reilianum]|uniref:DUF7702 domain-containing protein n=1 Tax=Sporisorium reilianum f. sp. reilianum TaxID=72559 RepID=A0A2N8UAQ7_9BASI|nr:uncharacterized protein SRS1_12943 [Sporisorium reilianum f. sp. reilianum]